MDSHVRPAERDIGLPPGAERDVRNDVCLAGRSRIAKAHAQDAKLTNQRIWIQIHVAAAKEHSDHDPRDAAEQRESPENGPLGTSRRSPSALNTPDLGSPFRRKRRVAHWPGRIGVVRIARQEAPLVNTAAYSLILDASSP